MSARLRGARLACLLLMTTSAIAMAQDDQAAPATASESDIDEAFARMDSNRDGQLSLEEFVAGITRPLGSQHEGVVYQKLPARFRMLDADADGFLDAGEYAHLALRWQGAGAAPPPLAQADRNHDGRIDFREFAFVHAPRDEAARVEAGD